LRSIFRYSHSSTATSPRKEAAAGAQQPVLEGQAGASGGSSASNGEEATDIATTITRASEGEDADARRDTGDTQAPAVSAQEEDIGDDDGAEVETVTSGWAEPLPATEAVSPPSTEAANDNDPPAGLPATGTE
jgi:hypothetical protein